ncbi:hypothetical protein BIW11_14031 [Tropilaelaps mercedesae]|uniref:Probable RNA polymerase II nuclear localization protein SLC7A6OS n=1 Tax=Tropilaelaps mercedesae TaxID=418985 RepID=A0A1V9WZN0_9ACAR|nr:hypothetical protein BIW11_14031 [Tropilaelaps mercedesae]
MSSAVIRVKRHVDDAPVEALRLAKRQRLDPVDGGNTHYVEASQENASKAASVTLAFVGTAQKADLNTVHSVIRRHRVVATTEKDAIIRTSEARRRKLQILCEHKKLLKSFPSLEEIVPDRSDDLIKKTGSDRENRMTMAELSGDDDDLLNGQLKIYDARHEDIIVPTANSNNTKSTIPSTSANVTRSGDVNSTSSRVEDPPSATQGCETKFPDLRMDTTKISSPDTATNLTGDVSADGDFVYDIYFARMESSGTDPALPDHKSYADDYVLEKIEPAQEILMFDDEFEDDPYLCRSDSDEDSNAEDNPRNEYPDEEDWYEDRGSESEWNSAEEAEGGLEQYDELGYIETRLRRLDFDGTALRMGQASDEDIDHEDELDLYAKDDSDSELDGKRY